MTDGKNVTALIPDNEVIGRVLQGETNMYALLVRRYNQRLYRIGMSMVNDDNEVEDVMQVAYINAYENLGKFEFKSSFATWITRIMINECLLRMKRRKYSFAMNDDLLDNNPYAFQPKTPLVNLMNVELKNALETAILQLPEKYRTVFVMREIEGMNIDETKACLDLSEANVKVRLNRAKAMLRSQLSALYKTEELLHFQLSRCDRITNRVMNAIEKS
jgi:RNA polymerase sigma factor (sigma-70 family)